MQDIPDLRRGGEQFRIRNNGEVHAEAGKPDLIILPVMHRVFPQRDLRDDAADLGNGVRLKFFLFPGQTEAAERNDRLRRVSISACAACSAEKSASAWI